MQSLAGLEQLGVSVKHTQTHTHTYIHTHKHKHIFTQNWTRNNPEHDRIIGVMEL